jgi:tetratricopeptide (TPR) repeat protein
MRRDTPDSRDRCQHEVVSLHSVTGSVSEPALMPSTLITPVSTGEIHRRPSDSNLPAPKVRRAWSDATLVGLLLLVTFICYGNILANGFVYDDDQQILQNPYITSWRFLPEIFGTTVWSFVGQAGLTNYYRPLMTLSYLLLWKAFGPIPMGFHLFCLTLHAAVVVVMFFVGVRIFRDRWIAWFSALLFALHPIHTEAVDWIAAVPDLEATLFLLLAVWAFADDARKDWRAKLATLACFALALLAKEPSLMFVLLAILFCHIAADGRNTTTFGQKVFRYLPLCVLGLAYLGLRILLFGKVAPVLQHPQVTWGQAIYSGFALILTYTRLLVWPARLSAFHVFHASTSLLDLQVLGGLGVVLVCLLGIFALRKAPPAAFALLWIGVTLAPVLNARWMAANVLTERYLYLPSVGFCWLLAWCLVSLWRSHATTAWPHARRVVAGLLLAVTAAIASYQIITRNRDWQTDFKLYTRTLQTDPAAYVIRSNLAGVYFESRDYPRAEQEWKTALAGKPDNVINMNALGVLYTVEARYPEAETMLTAAIAAKPLWADAHYNYGILLHKTGRDTQSLAEHKKAVELAPYNPQARRWYAEELVATGNDAEAETQFNQSLGLQSSYGALDGLASIYIRNGQAQKAEGILAEITRQFPYDGKSFLQLAKLLEADGRYSEARTNYKEVLITDPGNSYAATALKRLETR